MLHDQGEREGVEAGQEVRQKKAADKEVRGKFLPDFPILLDLERPAFEEIPDLPPAPAPSCASFVLLPSPSHLPLSPAPSVVPLARRFGRGRMSGKDKRSGRRTVKRRRSVTKKLFKFSTRLLCHLPPPHPN